MKTFHLVAFCTLALIALNVATASPPTNEAKFSNGILSIERLDENSDYSIFFFPQVSEEIRQRALRKLFYLPQFNVQDGLGDYDDDYRFFEPLGDIITADMQYQMNRQAINAPEWSGQTRPASVVLAK